MRLLLAVNAVLHAQQSISATMWTSFCSETDNACAYDIFNWCTSSRTAWYLLLSGSPTR